MNEQELRSLVSEIVKAQLLNEAPSVKIGTVSNKKGEIDELCQVLQVKGASLTKLSKLKINIQHADEEFDKLTTKIEDIKEKSGLNDLIKQRSSVEVEKSTARDEYYDLVESYANVDDLVSKTTYIVGPSYINGLVDRIDKGVISKKASKFDADKFVELLSAQYGKDVIDKFISQATTVTDTLAKRGAVRLDQPAPTGKTLAVGESRVINSISEGIFSELLRKVKIGLSNLFGTFKQIKRRHDDVEHYLQQFNI